MKRLSVVLLLIISSFTFAKTVDLTSDEKKSLPKNFLDSVDYEYGLGKSYKPSSLKEEIISFGESFYLDGYTTTDGYSQIKCKIDELLNLESIIKSNGLIEKQECFLNTFSSSTCIQNGKLSNYKNDSNKLCSSSSEKSFLLGFVDTENGKKAITKNYKLWKAIYSSFSSYVMKQVERNKGAYLAQRANATAGKCIEGLIRDIDYRAVVSNSCSAKSVSCSEHFDCCSGVCNKVNASDAKGMCSINYSCYEEIPKNDKCGVFSDGFVNSHCKDSSCLNIDYNSSDINECSGVSKSCSANTDCCSDSCVSGKCVEQSKCLQCSSNGESETTSKPCCPGLYKSIRGKCIPDFPPLVLPVVKSTIQKIFNLLIPSAHASQTKATEEPSANCVPGVNCNGTEDNTVSRLSEEQVTEIQKRTSACLKLEGDAKEFCFTAVADLRKSYLAENSDDNGVWDRGKYKDEHNTIAITSKTYSDVTKCEFNSFNDSWRDMSNAQRNAELVVRGFEYVYTGSGTEDYWVNKKGKNIYSQAKAIADKLRTNRSDLVIKMKEIDVSMACQCIAIFGVDKFSDAKKQFFNSDACADERKELGTLNIGSVDGSSQSGDDIESQEGEISEIDSGATGISHEAILVEWLKQKYEFQMDRFQANAEVEESINELVQFTVEDTDWEKGKMVDTELYQFTVRKMSGWFAFVVAALLVAVVATVIFLTGGIAASVLVSSWIAGTASFATFALVSVALHSAIWGTEHNHYFNDFVRKDWHKVNWLGTHKDKDLTRFYVGPHYKNNKKSHGADYNLTLSSDLKCDVRATSSQCLKNVHRTGFNDEARFLIDIKNPLFVDFNSTQMDTKHVKSINTAFSKGIEKLKSTYPGSRTNVRFLKKNFLGQKEYLEEFMINGGKYSPALFSKTLKKKFIDGIKKYSACKDLVECGAGVEYKDQSGFGYLFEKEQDIIDFSEYVYQHHFHWPSLSASNFLGYPLMAQRAYLETVSYNIKLVGSFAAAQGSGYGDAYFRYQSDWNTRRSAYDSVASAQLGSATKNVKYSKEFLDTFNTLNFSVGDGIAAFDTKLSSFNASASGGANSFESAALTAAKNKASQALATKKISDNYKEQTKNDTRSASKLAAQTELLNDFGAPVSNSGLTVGGTDLGNTGAIYGAGGSLSNVSNTLSKSDKKNSKNGSSSDKSSSNYASNNFNATKFGAGGSNGGIDSSFSMPSFDDTNNSSDSKTARNIKASGMSQEDIDRMLDATRKNSALKSSEDDNIFTALSKAYKRNYDAFFERKAIVKPKLEDKVETIDETKKSELKNLLGN